MRALLLSLGLSAVPDFLGTRECRIGFVPTAAHPYSDQSFAWDDLSRLKSLGYSAVTIDFDRQDRASIVNQLSSIDALFIAGGNTYYLLQSMQRQDLLADVEKLVRDGLPYIGASAGAVIAGPSIEPIGDLDDASAAPDLNGYGGLGISHTVVLPHYGKEKYMAKYAAILDEYGDEFRLLPLRDDEALMIENETYTPLNSGSLT